MGFPILVRWHLYIESGPKEAQTLPVPDTDAVLKTYTFGLERTDTYWKLEQLESLRPDDTPAAHDYHSIISHQLPSQSKTKSKLQIWRIQQKLKLL